MATGGVALAHPQMTSRHIFVVRGFDPNSALLFYKYVTGLMWQTPITLRSLDVILFMDVLMPRKNWTRFPTTFIMIYLFGF